jgi:hypothetical protein
MNNKFDELTKQMAQSVTRRGALKHFGVGLAGMALACFGLANRAQAQGNCLQAGLVCFRGLRYDDPSKDCRKCCNGYTCVPANWGLGKVCSCN